MCNCIDESQDKRTALYGTSLKYPHAQSLLSRTQKFGVVTSELSRYHRNSMEWTSFLALAFYLLKALRYQGYPRRSLVKYCWRYVRKHLPIYGDHSGKHTMGHIGNFMDHFDKHLNNNNNNPGAQ